MPLVEPANALREKLLLIAGGGAGKTSAHLSIAWWAFKSGDTRTFYILDTDDEAVLQVLAESKYDGMLRSFNDETINPDGNIVLFNAVEWEDYQNFTDKVLANAVKGDWVVLDFITHIWKAAQDGFIRHRTNQAQTREGALLEAGVKGAAGWDMYKDDVWNWQAINSMYDLCVKQLLLRSPAHIFMCSEEEEIPESSKLTPDAKEHKAVWGKYKFVGQKKLPYQCRSYLRLQRLARGRVLYTLKDRAREELNGADMAPDFFTGYCRRVAGWQVTSADDATPDSAD